MDNIQTQIAGRASNDSFTTFVERFLAALLLWAGILCLLGAVALGVFTDIKSGGLGLAGVITFIGWVVVGRIGRYGSLSKNG